MKQSYKIGYIFLYLLITNTAKAQFADTFKMEGGKGITFRSADSTFTLAFNGRVQSMMESTYNLKTASLGHDFFVRRCRLNFQGQMLSPKFTYRLHFGFSQGDISASNNSVQNNLILRDAFLSYKVNHWLKISLGQTKLPGNRQRLVSSSSLQLVERSIANNNFTLDRDKGIWFYTSHKLGKSQLKTTWAISSGEGRIISDKNGKLCYASRIEWLPLGEFKNNGDLVESDIEREKAPKLSIAAVYSFNEYTPRTMGQLGDFLYNGQRANIQYYGADMLFKYRGFSIEAEYYHRKSDKGIISNVANTSQKNYVISGNTLMVQAGIFLTKHLEIASRYAMIQPNAGVSSAMPKQSEMVFGLSHYFMKHSLKLQTDLTYLNQSTTQSLIYRVSAVVSF